MHPKAGPIDTSLITIWARERGFSQPWPDAPWHVKMTVYNDEIFIDLSSIDPGVNKFNLVADKAIANYYMAVGSNDVREALQKTLKYSTLPINDPTDIA